MPDLGLGHGAAFGHALSFGLGGGVGHGEGGVAPLLLRQVRGLAHGHGPQHARRLHTVCF